MDGVGGVHKQGRRARRIERSHHFAGNVGTFADARHHYPAPQGENSFHALCKIGGAGEGSGYSLNGLSFLLKHFFCQGVEFVLRFQSKFGIA